MGSAARPPITNSAGVNGTTNACSTTYDVALTIAMNDDARLREKLRAIEALFAGATTDGEREAADRARGRIAARLRELEKEKLIEWQFSLNPWSRRLLIALARRYGLKPYRYRRQRHSTLVLKAPEQFLKETFLPAYDAMVKTLDQHLTEVAERVIAEVIDSDRSEPAIEEEPRQLSFAGNADRLRDE